MGDDSLVEQRDFASCDETSVTKEPTLQKKNYEAPTAARLDCNLPSDLLNGLHPASPPNPGGIAAKSEFSRDEFAAKIDSVPVLAEHPMSTVVQIEQAASDDSGAAPVDSHLFSSLGSGQFPEWGEKGTTNGLEDSIQATKPIIQDNKNSHTYEEGQGAKTGDMEKGNLFEKETARPSKDATISNSAGQIQDHASFYGFYSLLFNLIKAMIGTGILFLPQRAAALGAIPSLFLLFFSAFCSGLGLILYLWLCSKVGRNSSIKTLSDVTYKSFGIIFNLIIVPKCFLVATLYIKLACEYLYTQLFPGQVSRWKYALFTIVVAFSVLPFVLLTKMGKLRYTSYAAFGAILFLVAFSIMLFAKYGSNPAFPEPAVTATATKFILFAPSGFKTLLGYFQGISTFMFSFTCHQNVFPIYNEARNNSSKSMRNLVFLSIGISLCIYVSFMLFSLGTFGTFLGKDGDILNTYARYLNGRKSWMQPLAVTCQILFAIVLLFSVASQTLPLKSSFVNVLPVKEETLAARSKEINWAISVTTVMLAALIVMFAERKSIGYFVSIIGSICSPLLMAVVPSLYYLKLVKHKMWGWKKISVLAFCIFGIILIGFCTAAAIYTIVSG